MNRRALFIGLGLGLAVAIAGATAVLLALREDRGFVATWPATATPVRVVLSPEAADYLGSARRGVVLWNQAAGCLLLREPVVAEPIATRGSIVFRVDPKLGDDPGDRDSWPHGTFTANGPAVVAASLILPPITVFNSSARADRVIAHELGHGLGHDPDHDDQEGSVMYRRASGPSGKTTGTYGVTEKDRARLSYLCALRR